MYSFGDNIIKIVPPGLAGKPSALYEIGSGI